jgi:hypothetical protein
MKLKSILIKLILEFYTSVCSPTVRIIAFQAIDPGSTPGRRIFLFFAFRLTAFKLVTVKFSVGGNMKMDFLFHNNLKPPKK